MKRDVVALKDKRTGGTHFCVTKPARSCPAHMAGGLPRSLRLLIGYRTGPRNLRK